MNRRALPIRRLRRVLPTLLIAGLVLAACGPNPLSPFPAREGGTRGEGAPPSRVGRGDGGVGPRAAQLEAASDAPNGLSAADLAGIREQIERDRYRIEHGNLGIAGAPTYHAGNPVQRLRLGFGVEGVTVSQRDDADWSLGLRLASWGFGAEQRATAPVEPIADENRVEYRRGVLTEWYVNERRGLEQGFTLLEPPAADPGGGRLRLELVAGGDLAAQLADDGRAIVWQDEAGRTMLRYGGLAAWDAGGRALPTALGLSAGGFWLEVDDRAAEYPLTIDPFIQQPRLEPPGGTNENFGLGVAVDGDTALVGAPGTTIDGKFEFGAAYVFVRNGTIWSRQQRLLASDGAASNVFGFSVALSGDTALIGAPGAGGPGNAGRGAAYVFVRNGATWTEQQKLTASDGVGGDEFGRAVALSGDTALIGAPSVKIGTNFRQGAAYVFVRSGTSWAQQGLRLIDAGGADQDFFGISVAVSGDTALVGAVFATVDGKAFQGAAYVFVRSGSNWTQQGPRLLAEDGEAQEQFGTSVALSGDTALIGAATATVAGKQAQGAAYVFVRSGTTWAQQQKLLAPDGAGFHFFGTGVALSGETALVGSPHAGAGQTTNVGAGYAFVRSGTVWSFQQKLTAADGADGDNVGSRVALSGDTALLGAVGADVGGNQSQGAAYVFVRSGTTWAEQQELLADGGLAGDQFGLSVALSGDTALVGAPSADIGAKTDQGAAYIFVHSGTTWVPRQRLLADDGSTGHTFGQSVALSGETALIGAPNAVVGGQVKGAAYVFVLGDTTWTQQQKLTASDGAPVDFFGQSVALSGETVLVGAPGVDPGGNQAQGAAYVLVRTGTSWAQQGPRLLADDGGSGDQLGWSVVLDGETALLGAPGADGRGAAYAFVRNGTAWAQQQKLVPTSPLGVGGDQFGWSVALSGDTALVGAPQVDLGNNDNQGAAYAFLRSGSAWTQQGPRLTADDGAPNDFFGYGVALDGETALVGAFLADVDGRSDQGAVYRFTRSGGAWERQPKLTAADGVAGDSFGVSVALSGETGLAGAVGVDGSGQANRGAAYSFGSDSTATPTATPTSTATATATATATPTVSPTPDANSSPTATATATATATPTFVPCKTIKPKLKAKLRKGTRTADLAIDPKSFARPCSFVRAVVDWGDGSPPETLTTPNATHTYAAAGPFTLNVRLTDNGGHVDVLAKPKKLKVK